MTTSEARRRAMAVWGLDAFAVKRKGSAKSGRLLEHSVGVLAFDEAGFVAPEVRGRGGSWEEAFAAAGCPVPPKTAGVASQ